MSPSCHKANGLRRSIVPVATLLAAILASASVFAVGFEKLVMPGRVIEGHAEVEGECGECHDVDTEAAIARLCTSCHEEIGEDRRNRSGFHGRFPPSRDNECVVCHTDHEGRDADIVKIGSGIFDHSFTDFPLVDAHLEASCDDCHTQDEAFRDAARSCIGCHADDDVHEGTLGQACADCHNEVTWNDTTFDHSTTDYPLTGAHMEVGCNDCHRNKQYEDTPRACVSCHAIDDVHEGSNGNACYECHSTSTWGRIGFNHLKETGFALSGGHGGLICNDCHRREDFKDDFSRGCIDCHAPDDLHQNRNGTECDSCHAADDWANNSFDHGETGFALVEAHADLNCVACHKDELSIALPTDCGGCHELDDAHAGQLGANCESCHGQTDWQSPVVFDHDLSSFPLIGLHATTACGSCHDSRRFADAETTCIACHGPDDVHEGALGSECGDCHTSNGWPITVFDHDTHTNFPLDGGHTGLACTACHRDEDQASDVPSSCGGCHASDDVHDGQFGTQCAQCHSTSSFKDVEHL